MNAPLLEAIDLHKRYYLGGVIAAVTGVNLQVDAGEFVSIVGPSGCGKSTLLGLLGALDLPTQGEVRLDGRNLADLNSRQLAEVRCQHIGFVFQFFHLIPHLTAWENVALPLRLRPPGRREARQRAFSLLDQVGLGDRREHRPLQLSGGQQQRVAIARALANHPRVVLADEPTGNLDSRAGEEVVELFLDLNARLGQTFVVVTHDAALAQRASRIVRMADGRIL